MKKPTVLFALVLVGGTVATIEELRIAALSEELAALRRVPPGPTPEIRPAPSRQSDHGQATATRTTKTERPANREATSVGGGYFRRIIENPAARAMMNQGHKAMAGAWFADLIRQFDFNQAEADHFTSLVAGSLTDQQDFGMKLMNAKDEAERKQLVQEMLDSCTGNDAAIREFLNDDKDFAAYQLYFDRLPERQQLDGIRAFMRGEGCEIPPEQNQPLVDAMYRARATVTPEMQREQQPETMGFLAPGAEERFEQSWAAMQNALRREVPNVLDARQTEAFFNYQSKSKDMQLMGLQMARTMMEDRAENPATPPVAPAPPRQ